MRDDPSGRIAAVATGGDCRAAALTEQNEISQLRQLHSNSYSASMYVCVQSRLTKVQVSCVLLANGMCKTKSTQLAAAAPARAAAQIAARTPPSRALASVYAYNAHLPTYPRLGQQRRTHTHTHNQQHMLR